MLPATEIPALSQEIASEQQAKQQQVESSARKATRHWEAWTHEEEEKFFVALRQVGKNFERITSQVQSKNKNQVRHYYYRLIRRMNKLLSSDFSLDARNPKDVNAAMLCWWSLLEKHRCSSSKLHLKPRRLKAFVTALEQQLLRYRKKAKKKPRKGDSISTGEPDSTAVSTPVRSTRAPTPVKCESSPQKTSDVRSVSDDMHGASTELRLASGSPHVTSDCLKSEVCVGEAASTSQARTAEVDPIRSAPSDGGQNASAPKLSAQTASDTETALMKIKLQLFPMDEATRTTLERDGHNPHLELTLKLSKSITSVLQHLSQKWGGSSVATGELRLYPYVSHSRGVASAASWGSKDIDQCAADVYAAVGKPPVFRLRYGWSRTDCLDAAPPKSVDTELMKDFDSQTPGCAWLYQKSMDGFGQRLWRDVDPSNGGVCTMDWVDSLTVNVSPEDPSKHFSEATSSIWGGEETCDAFLFRRKEKAEELLQKDLQSPLLGNSQGVPTSSEGVRSSSLDLYWADSLGATFPSVQGSNNALLNGSSSLGAGVSGSLFSDSLDGFPP